VSLDVRPSSIAGDGLFACTDTSEGARLGRFSGRIVFESESRDVAEDWALARKYTRLILVRYARMWHVIDVRGSVFEWANSSDTEEGANMHVSRAGWCEAMCDIAAGDEVVWWYGDLYGFA